MPNAIERQNERDQKLVEILEKVNLIIKALKIKVKEENNARKKGKKA